MAKNRKTNKHPNDDSVESETNTPSFRIEYHPQLVEECVLLAITEHPDEGLFRKERDAIYELQDADTKEELFQALHLIWFNRLQLISPLQEVLAYWPILKLSTHKCLLIKARSQKGIGAELYVTEIEARLSDREIRSIVIQLTANLLTQAQQFLTFLRNELLHIVDMLDPQFAYNPILPKAKMGPVYDRILQERYRIMWDIYIDGRLYQNGCLPSTTKEKHWILFKDTFPGTSKQQEIVFSFFFNNSYHTHEELLSFSQNPENWNISSDSKLSARGSCPLCHFPSFHLIDASIHLAAYLINKIQEAHPNWLPGQLICQQCADLYEARSLT